MALPNKDFAALLNSAQGFVVYRLDVLDLQAGSGGARVAFVSPSIEQVMGVAKETPFANWFDGIHEDDRQRVEAASNQSARSGEAFDETFRIFHAQEQAWRWVHAISHPVPGDQQTPLHFNGMIIDVTAQKDSERREAKLREQLEQSQRLEALGLLAGGIAHDFNNLLMVIGGNAAMLRSDLEQNAAALSAAEWTDQIEEAVAKGAELTRQLLNYARKGVSTEELVDTLSLVSNTVEALVRTRKDVVLHHRSDGPLWASVDTVEFERVVMNVVANALDAMPDGGELTVSTTAAAPGSNHLMQIIDTGHGMDEDVLRNMFDPFFTTKSRGRGTGLGLAAARGIVQGFGGNVYASSQPGQGTVLSIELASVSPPVSRQQAVARAEAELPLAAQHILVVDDEAPVRAVLCSILHSLGHSTKSAESGSEALDLVAGEQFDLVILDMMMPGLSGGRLARALRDRHDGPLPFLVCSGYSDERHVSEALAAGADGFIRKPVTRTELSKRVATVVSR